VTEPLWLSLEIALDIHAELLGHFGGKDGLRDRGGLEAALDRPRNKFAYGDRDIATLAAAYAFGLSRGHAFVDGNKRVAFAAMIVFLGLNGRRLLVPEPEATAMMLSLAAGEIDEDLLTRWIEEHCQPAKSIVRLER
jgi:death-on-curing protein